MNFRSVGKPGYLLGLFVALLLLCGRTDAAENHLVRGGKAECAVVVEPKAGEFYGFVGQEIQRYIATLTGASSDRPARATRDSQALLAKLPESYWRRAHPPPSWRRHSA